MPLSYYPDRLRERAHDTDEGVRQEVVTAIVATAKRDISNLKEDLLTLVKERTLDKKVSHVLTGCNCLFDKDDMYCKPFLFFQYLRHL